MSNTGQAWDQEFRRTFQHIFLSPWGDELQCLDVFTTTEDEGLLARLFGGGSSAPPKAKALVRMGSMLDSCMIRDISAWGQDPIALGRELKGLKDAPVTEQQPSLETQLFKKNRKPAGTMRFKVSRRFSAVIADIAGLVLKQNQNLTLTVDGLTTVSVCTNTTITGWANGRWLPNTDYISLFKPSSKHSVLYATKLTVQGDAGIFTGVQGKVPAGVTGIPANLGAKLTFSTKRENEFEITAAPGNKPFQVGYRLLKLEFNSEGTQLLHVQDNICYKRDTTNIGDNEDSHDFNLRKMEEELFHKDEDGDFEPIPLLTPSEEDLNKLKVATASEQIS
ncbi:unnamed protein product [Sphagnum jensenii]|uniref:Uncharacterized protein n=2 Tax=Sphagnum jensenii TaxID=128206 RepID=A0ABP1AA17_9BRYO